MLVSASAYYGSGFADNGGPDHLPGHTTMNLAVRKSLGTRASVGVTVINVTNNRVLIDNSLTFGGTHFNEPRQVYVQFSYKFHY